MPYESINPYSGQSLKKYSFISENELDKKLDLSGKAWEKWSGIPLGERCRIIKKAGKSLSGSLKYNAGLITSEMGKPVRESKAEIEKCVGLCEYYVNNAEKLLVNEDYSDNNHKSYVSVEPTGVVFAVMPWNFPYWQVFRFLIPNLILGNGALLKHASNVPQCAEAIEKIFLDSGIPEGVFQNLFIDYKQSQTIIKQSFISGVTLTGSEKAGKSIAEIAGRNIKKTVLELGGSDPFIVLEDANPDIAATSGLIARMRNAGQSCISAKRFIVHKKIFDDFVSAYSGKAGKLILGNPMSESTDMGPLANVNLLKELEVQVDESIKKGAEIIKGGKKSNAGKLFYEPTVVVNISRGMPLYHEETFGPVASVFKFENINEAISLANDTEFGLGASIWTKDIDLAGKVAKQIRTGTVAVNGIVASESHIPFGGVKKSGYGRELSGFGIKEFANIKTVNIFS